MGENVHLIAQVLPNYDTVTLTNNCIFKCREQADGHGGILALRANTMTIDSSSKIWTTGQGIFVIFLVEKFALSHVRLLYGSVIVKRKLIFSPRLRNWTSTYFPCQLFTINDV